MSETIEEMGMVISSMPIGEYDRRIVLLTQNLGKITAFARGARKPTSPFLSGTNPMSFGKFSLYHGRNSYTLRGINVMEYFSAKMPDEKKLYMGMYFLELAAYFTREGLEAKDQLALLYSSIKKLSDGDMKTDLARCIYELKSLVYYGEYPNVYRCGICQGEKDLSAFDIKKGIMLCSKCRYKGAFDLNTSTVYAMQYIVSSPLEKLFSFDLTDKVLFELKSIVEEYLEEHMDRKMKTLEFL